MSWGHKEEILICIISANNKRSARIVKDTFKDDGTQ
jgi:hypothetical protein